MRPISFQLLHRTTLTHFKMFCSHSDASALFSVVLLLGCLPTTNIGLMFASGTSAEQKTDYQVVGHFATVSFSPRKAYRKSSSKTKTGTLSKWCHERPFVSWEPLPLWEFRAIVFVFHVGCSRLHPHNEMLMTPGRRPCARRQQAVRFMLAMSLLCHCSRCSIEETQPVRQKLDRNRRWNLTFEGTTTRTLLFLDARRAATLFHVFTSSVRPTISLLMSPLHNDVDPTRAFKNKKKSANPNASTELRATSTNRAGRTKSTHTADQERRAERNEQQEKHNGT